jgi:hypothetical protein
MFTGILQVWEMKRGEPGDYLLKNSQQTLHKYLPIGSRVAILVRSGFLLFFAGFLSCRVYKLSKYGNRQFFLKRFLFFLNF